MPNFNAIYIIFTIAKSNYVLYNIAHRSKHMKNLYWTIKLLYEEKIQLYRAGGKIKFDKEKREEYILMCKRYEQVCESLKALENKYVITCQDLAKIISKNLKQEYKLKIFQETYEKDGKTYYTNRFIACYLNDTNKFFNYDKDAFILNNWGLKQNEVYANYSLTEKEFAELKASLTQTNSYILARSEELNFVPAIPPSCYLEKINFVKNFTRNSFDDFASFNFQHLTKFWLKQELETITPNEIEK